MSFFKNKLREISRQLYLENGWQMPRGLIDPNDRDPRNFSLDEWQQAKRIGRHAGELKEQIQEAWGISDSRQTFSHALEERGLYLARGNRRGYIAVTFEGEVISIPRAIGQKSKELHARLGNPYELPSAEETRMRIAKDILPRIKTHIEEARSRAKQETETLAIQRREMANAHAQERAKLDTGQKQRYDREFRERAERFRKGMRGLWDRLTGKRVQLEKKNQFEAIWALRRDQDQRQMVINAQLGERRELQFEIKAARSRHAKAIRGLHFDVTNYRPMKRGEEPRAKKTFERLDSLRDNTKETATRPRFDQLKVKELEVKVPPISSEERLRRLREKRRDGPFDGPDFDH